jgi:quercetin dioxygenase-like cupin family protein
MGQGASLAIGVMLVGQRSPQHTSTGEHLLLGLEGEITWELAGTEEVVMGAMDLVFIGPDCDYHYWNSGLTTARFVDVIGRVDAWPHSASYASEAGDGETLRHIEP